MKRYIETYGGALLENLHMDYRDNIIRLVRRGDISLRRSAHGLGQWGGGRGAHMLPTRDRAPSPILIREVPHTVYFILVVQKAILIIIKAKRFVYFIIEIHHLVPFVKEFYNAVSFYNT